MPSVTQEEPVFHSSKKRKLGDDGGPDLELYDALSYRRPTLPGSSRQLQASDHLHLHHRHHHHYVRTPDGDIIRPDELVSNPLLARKVLPSIQPPKRFRSDDDGASPHSPGREQRRVVAVPYSRQHYHPHKPQSPSSSGAGGVPHEITTTGLPGMASSSSRLQSAAPARAPSALAPCHICARRPTKKSDLDSFADCEGCGLRACYVCMRECLGWGDGETPTGHAPSSSSSSFKMEDRDSPVDPNHGGGSTESGAPVWLRGGNGHRQMICSRCCVEQGADGDVICLGCLQRR